MFREPPSVTCYICGRKFGTASISIHQPQCAKRWEDTEALKPKKERRPLPKPPVVEPERQLGKGEKLSAAAQAKARDAYNEAAMDKFQNESLVPCPNCGRTFLPDRLQVHLRSCNSDRPAKASTSGQARLGVSATQSGKPCSTQAGGISTPQPKASPLPSKKEADVPAASTATATIDMTSVAPQKQPMIDHPLPSGAASTWSVTDMTSFFASLSFPQDVTEKAVKEVLESQVDGEVLATLTEKDVIDGFSLTKLQARKVVTAFAKANKA